MMHKRKGVDRRLDGRRSCAHLINLAARSHILHLEMLDMIDEVQRTVREARES
jgi:hypothetical protein